MSVKQYDYETSTMVGNVLGSYRERELARKEVFGEPQLLEFENLKISCHANPDEYLTKYTVITCNCQKKLSVRVISSLRGEIKLNSFNLMGVRIDPLTMDETVQAVEKFVLEQRPTPLNGSECRQN